MEPQRKSESRKRKQKITEDELQTIRRKMAKLQTKLNTLQQNNGSDADEESLSDSSGKHLVNHVRSSKKRVFSKMAACLI